VVDNADFTVGAVKQPITSSLTDPLVFDADPAVAYSLDFWTFLITQYVEPRLVAALAAAGVKDNTGAAIDKAVKQSYSFIPTPELLDSQIKFPMLALGRVRSLTGRFTASWEHDRGIFALVYALPPLDSAQAYAITPVFRLIEALLRKKTTQSFDPAYTPPGGKQGESPWGIARAGVERIGFGDPYRDPADCTEYGELESTKGLVFPCIRMTGYFVERDMYTAAQHKFLGADITGNLVAPDGTEVASFMQAATQPATTLASLNPASGPAAGGTSVTITGTGFLQQGSQPIQVFFGKTAATNVVWVSPTQITCTTPAVSGSGPLAVTVVNADGQQATIGEQARMEGAPGVQFYGAGAVLPHLAHSIERTAGSWIADGFAVGQTPFVSGSDVSGNVGVLPPIASLTATALVFGSAISDEGPLGDVFMFVGAFTFT
jgi:hypothetical protein